MKRNNFIFLLMIMMLLSKIAVAKGPHFGNPNLGDPGYMLETTFGTNNCKPCHMPHSTRGENRLWPVGTPGTGATVIQNLCMYCHSEVKTVDQVDDDGDGFPDGANYGAHILNQAHGQHGPSYNDTDTANADTTARYGPGHLYRHSSGGTSNGDSVLTRDRDDIIGYGSLYSYDQYGFETMAYSADSSFNDVVTQDFSKLSRLSCFSCHDPHGAYITNYIDRAGATTDTYDSSQANNYIKFWVGDDTTAGNPTKKPTYYESIITTGGTTYIGRTRKVCLGCHYGGMEPPSSGYYNLPANPTIIDGIIPPLPPGRNQVDEGKKNVGAHYNGKSKCVSCHPWDWPPPNCTECHGYPPSGATGSPPLDKHYPQDYNSTNKPAFTIDRKSVV